MLWRSSDLCVDVSVVAEEMFWEVDNETVDQNLLSAGLAVELYGEKVHKVWKLLVPSRRSLVFGSGAVAWLFFQPRRRFVQEWRQGCDQLPGRIRRTSGKVQEDGHEAVAHSHRGPCRTDFRGIEKRNQVYR